MKEMFATAMHWPRYCCEPLTQKPCNRFAHQAMIDAEATFLHQEDL